MNVSFYNEDNKRNLLLSYETSSYNNIPRIGEKVVIKNKWYLVEDIINMYTKIPFYEPQYKSNVAERINAFPTHTS